MGKYVLKKYLGHGAGRVVYLLPDEKSVIKIPYSQRGVQQNEEEYARYCASVEPYFADILFFDDTTKLLVMQYIDIAPAEFFQDYAYDQTHCSLYDDALVPRRCGCDARCSACKYNTVPKCLPPYYEELLAVCPKDRPQIGYDAESGRYKYYDYGNSGSAAPEEQWYFWDSYAALFKVYFERGGDPLEFAAYMQKNFPTAPANDRNDPDAAIHKRNKTARRKYCDYRRSIDLNPQEGAEDVD